MTIATTEPGDTPVSIVHPDTMAIFTQMAAGIPATAGEDAYDEILTQIFNAAGVDDLNAPWDTHKAEQLEGHRLRFDSVKRSESDFTEGLGMYLVLKGVNLTSGEKFTLTIGSVAVLGQVAKIHYMDGFPFTGRIVVAERPTKRGYRPIHLQVIALRTAE